MNMRRLRSFGWVAMLIPVVLVGWYLLRPKPEAVDIVEISRGLVEVVIEEEGETRVRDVYQISAPIAGKLERLELDAGDEVVRGQRVARVRPVDPPIRDSRTRRELAAATLAASAMVRLARAELAQAHSLLRFAQSDLERAQQLSANNNISRRALEQAMLEVDGKQAQVQRAEANLELRQSELDYARIRESQPTALVTDWPEDQCCVAVVAPETGVVLRILTESEQVVQAGTAILETGNPRDLEIVVDLLSADAVRISSGTMAGIEDWGHDKVLEARVRRIDPAGFTKISALGIEEQRVNVILDIISPAEDWASLGHAFRVLVRLQVSQNEDALRVPLGALFRVGNDWAVFVNDDGVASERHIVLGRFSDIYAEVLDGMTAGENVIVYPSDQISDGVAIEARE
ncbi:MAG: HlyD family efflux transporter periplasmic adaptor subunit [Rhizobiales bacterium]|nr:HlyD family efflux transporter periplasmic adaptor subunit [Hyphomicrobiales bacterium]